jgi:hypothetical protein
MNSSPNDQEKTNADGDSNEINRLLQVVKTKLTSEQEALSQLDAYQVVQKLFDIQRDCTTAFYKELNPRAEADQQRSLSHVASSIANLNTIELTWCLQCHRKQAVTKAPYPIFPLPMQDEQGNYDRTSVRAFRQNKTH